MYAIRSYYALADVIELPKVFFGIGIAGVLLAVLLQMVHIGKKKRFT